MIQRLWIRFFLMILFLKNRPKGSVNCRSLLSPQLLLKVYYCSPSPSGGHKLLPLEVPDYSHFPSGIYWLLLFYFSRSLITPLHLLKITDYSFPSGDSVHFLSSIIGQPHQHRLPFTYPFYLEVSLPVRDHTYSPSPSRGQSQNRGWVSDMLTFSLWKSALLSEASSYSQAPSGNQFQRQRMDHWYADLLLLEVSIAEWSLFQLTCSLWKFV